MGNSHSLKKMKGRCTYSDCISCGPPDIAEEPCPSFLTGISGTASAENLGETPETTDSLPRQPLWFDYPDSDKKKILAVYKLIGEEHVFVRPSSFPHILRYILVGSVVLTVLFFLYQILSKVITKRPRV